MRSSKKVTFGAISALIAVVIIFHVLGWTRPLDEAVQFFFDPISGFLYRTRVNVYSNPASLGYASSTGDESGDRMAMEKTRIVLLEEENEALRQQLQFFHTATATAIVADVIGKNIEPFGNSILINRGSSVGIVKGDPVIVHDGVLIGKIANVDRYTAVVRLLSDSQSKVAVTLLNQERSLGLVEGGYGISVQMNFVPQNEKVSVGDSVITSGLEASIPRGLLIGTVEAVEKEAYQAFQRATISPRINFEKLTIVTVLETVSSTLGILATGP